MAKYGKDIYDKMNLKSTDELLEIWKEHDASEYIEEVFWAVEAILTERNAFNADIESCSEEEHSHLSDLSDEKKEMVTIGEFQLVSIAEMVAEMLRNEGIEVMVVKTDFTTSAWGADSGISGPFNKVQTQCRLDVPLEQSEQALAILEEVEQAGDLSYNSEFFPQETEVSELVGNGNSLGLSDINYDNNAISSEFSSNDSYDPSLDGIAGWLILPAIGIVAGVVTFLFQIYNSSIIFLETNDILLAVGLIIDSGLLAFLVYIATRFFGKKENAPRTFIIFSKVMIFSHVLVGVFILLEGNTVLLGKSIGGIIGNLIWIEYFKKSKRVKMTFTR